jgi:hypothetical protein
MMPREQRVNDLRHDGFVIADYARKERISATELLEQVVTYFVSYRPKDELRAA